MTPLTLDLLKDWLRVTSNDEDVLLGVAMRAAVRHIEGQTGVLFARREVTQPLYNGRLLYGPDRGTITVAWTDDGVAQTEAGVVIGDTLTNTIYPGATATYEAGYADPEDVPEDLLVAALLLAGNWDANREATAGNLAPLPFGVESLIGNYRPVLV